MMIREQDSATRRLYSCIVLRVAIELHNAYARDTCSFPHELNVSSRHGPQSTTTATPITATPPTPVPLPSSIGGAPREELSTASHTEAALTQAYRSASTRLNTDKEDSPPPGRDPGHPPLLDTYQHAFKSPRPIGAAGPKSLQDGSRHQKNAASAGTIGKPPEAIPYVPIVEGVGVLPAHFHTIRPLTEASSAGLQHAAAGSTVYKKGSLKQSQMAFNGDDINRVAFRKHLTTVTPEARATRIVNFVACDLLGPAAITRVAQIIQDSNTLAPEGKPTPKMPPNSSKSGDSGTATPKDIIEIIRIGRVDRLNIAMRKEFHVRLLSCEGSIKMKVLLDDLFQCLEAGDITLVRFIDACEKKTVTTRDGGAEIVNQPSNGKSKRNGRHRKTILVEHIRKWIGWEVKDWELYLRRKEVLNAIIKHYGMGIMTIWPAMSKLDVYVTKASLARLEANVSSFSKQEDLEAIFDIIDIFIPGLRDFAAQMDQSIVKPWKAGRAIPHDLGGNSEKKRLIDFVRTLDSMAGADSPVLAPPRLNDSAITEAYIQEARSEGRYNIDKNAKLMIEEMSRNESRPARLKENTPSQEGYASSPPLDAAQDSRKRQRDTEHDGHGPHASTYHSESSQSKRRTAVPDASIESIKPGISQKHGRAEKQKPSAARALSPGHESATAKAQPAATSASKRRPLADRLLRPITKAHRAPLAALDQDCDSSVELSHNRKKRRVLQTSAGLPASGSTPPGTQTLDRPAGPSPPSSTQPLAQSGSTPPGTQTLDRPAGPSPPSSTQPLAQSGSTPPGTQTLTRPAGLAQTRGRSFAPLLSFEEGTACLSNVLETETRAGHLSSPSSVSGVYGNGTPAYRSDQQPPASDAFSAESDSDTQDLSITPNGGVRQSQSSQPK